MPHVIIKAWPGKSEEQKRHLAKAVTQDVMAIFGYDEGPVSVSIEEIAPDRWKEDVYLPDIQAHPDRLYKKPGYEM